MSWITNKVYYWFIYITVCLMSVFIAVSPAIISIWIPENLMWIVILMIPFTVGQIFFVATPIITVLEAYKNANSKRGLIHEQDIYKLFEKNGTAKLHVGDIDQLPRYNVDIPDTKYQLFTETIPVIEDSSGTERNITRSYVQCLHCNMTLPASIIDDEDFKHCPCCGNRISRFRVPTKWYEDRTGEKVTDETSTK